MREKALGARSDGRPDRRGLDRGRLRRFRAGEALVGDVAGPLGGGARFVPGELGNGPAAVELGEEDGEDDGLLLVGLGLGDVLGLGDRDGLGLRDGDADGHGDGLRC
jgi:hypothetical protein